MDCTENTVSLMLFNCCLVNNPENTIPLLFAGLCLAMAAVHATVYRDMCKARHMHCFKSSDCVGPSRIDLFSPSDCCPFHILLLYMLINGSVLCVNELIFQNGTTV